jgi:hypothetical protein
MVWIVEVSVPCSGGLFGYGDKIIGEVQVTNLAGMGI